MRDMRLEVEKQLELKSQRPLMPQWKMSGEGYGFHETGMAAGAGKGNYAATGGWNSGQRMPGRKCWGCGQEGHMYANCPNKNPGNGLDHRPPCPHCGKRTHSANNCWELEANTHKRPFNWVSVKDGTIKFRNRGGEPGNIVQVCSVCESPKHKTEECPTVKLRNISIGECKPYGSSDTKSVGSKMRERERGVATRSIAYQESESDDDTSRSEYGFMGGANSLGEEGTAETLECGNVTWVRAGGNKSNGAG